MNPTRIAVLFVALAVSLASCLASPPGRPGAVRSTAVSIYAQCASPLGVGTWGGSGAAVGPTHVLTAYHVVENCPGSTYLVETSDGSTMIAHLERLDAPDDLALLRVSGRFDDWLRPGGDLSVGQWVCSTASQPEPRRRCGRVLQLETGCDPLRPCRRVGVSSVPGNSGSPVTDESGRLVGVVYGTFRAGGGSAVSRLPGWVLP